MLKIKAWKMIYLHFSGFFIYKIFVLLGERLFSVLRRNIRNFSDQQRNLHIFFPYAFVLTFQEID